MSVQDTDYKIVITGNPPEARLAAADYFLLLLDPWGPWSRYSARKGKVIIGVFRNEWHTRGFLEPVTLAQEAATYFPWISIHVEGISDDYNICDYFEEQGSLPNSPWDLVSEKVLSKVIAEVEPDSSRHRWLERLMEWTAGVDLKKSNVKKIQDQFKITLAAAKKAREDDPLEAEKKRKERFENQNTARKFFRENLIWKYEPDSALRPIDPILIQEGEIYFTTKLSGSLRLQKLNHRGELILSVPTDMKTIHLTCLDEELFYFSGAKIGSKKNDPNCISAITRHGVEAWRIDLKVDSLLPSPKKDLCQTMGVSPDLLVYCTRRHGNPSLSRSNLVAVDRKSGGRRWSRQLKGRCHLAIDSSQIYVVDKTRIYAFDMDGGDVWSQKLPEIILRDDNRNVCGLALDGQGTLFLTLRKKGIAALDCEDGKTRWIADGYAQTSCIVGGDGRCYLQCVQKQKDDEYLTEVYSFDSKTGAIIWKSEIHWGEWCCNPPMLTTKGILISAQEKLICLDLKNGSVLWRGAAPFKTSGVNLTTGGLILVNGSVGDEFAETKCAICCIGGDHGILSGPWPIFGGNGAGSNYLATAPKGGFKEFIADWRGRKPVAWRLAKLHPGFKEESQISSHVHGIIRGRELLKNAKEWSDPAIGRGPSSKYRGLQWKLVMAYSGTELLVKSVTPMVKGGLVPMEVEALSSKLPLPAFEPISSPSLERQPILDWLDELDRDAVFDFLKTDTGDRNQIQSWLFERKPCSSWSDAVLLAKALRNCTAHGALSPNKVEQWGIAEAFKRLTKALFKIETAIFEVLGS